LTFLNTTQHQLIPTDARIDAILTARIEFRHIDNCDYMCRELQKVYGAPQFGSRLAFCEPRATFLAIAPSVVVVVFQQEACTCYEAMVGDKGKFRQ
jgi:hypothetical protein